MRYWDVYTTESALDLLSQLRANEHVSQVKVTRQTDYEVVAEVTLDDGSVAEFWIPLDYTPEPGEGFDDEGE